MVGTLCWHCGSGLTHTAVLVPSLRSWGPWQGWEFLNAWGSKSATPHTSLPHWVWRGRGPCCLASSVDGLSHVEPL